MAPPSASNAGYRVGCMISVERDERDGGAIQSKKVKHAALSSTRGGEPLSMFWQVIFISLS
jgi:hypothetical protein